MTKISSLILEALLMSTHYIYLLREIRKMPVIVQVYLGFVQVNLGLTSEC